MALSVEAYLAHHGVDPDDPAAMEALAKRLGATVTRRASAVERPAPRPGSPSAPAPDEWVEVRLPLPTPPPGTLDEAVSAAAGGPRPRAVREAVTAVLAAALEAAEATEAARAADRYLGLPAVP